MTYDILKRHIVVLLLLFLSVGKMFAQTNFFEMETVDPQRDSVFFSEMSARFDEIRKERPTVALVLAGGGVKGLAHVGVVKYLEEKGVPVDMVLGTSMGGLVAVMYSLGYSAEEMDSIMHAVRWDNIITDDIPRKYFPHDTKKQKDKSAITLPFEFENMPKRLPSGLLYGYNVSNLISSLSVGYHDSIDFVRLPVPFCCIAYDIVSQKEKVWTCGSLFNAARSTMSIPGAFYPVRTQGMVLVDGAVKNNFPTDIAKAAGVDIIIGVDFDVEKKDAEIGNIIDILEQTIMASSDVEKKRKNADLLIIPNMSDYESLEFKGDVVDAVIGEGYQCAAAKEDDIDKILLKTGRSPKILYNKKALNINENKVKLSDVDFEGVNEGEEVYLFSKLQIGIGDFCSRDDIESAVATLYGHDCFNQVSYRLVENDEGYVLTFVCEKKPANSLHLGFRTDTEETVASMFTLGIGSNNVIGSMLNITLKVGLSPYFKTKYEYVPKKGPKFGVSMLNLYRTHFGYEPVLLKHKYNEQSWRNEFRAYIANTHWNNLEVNVGVKIQNMPFNMVSDEVGQTIVRDYGTLYSYAYVSAMFDNLDDGYFPHRGIKAGFDYDFSLSHTHAQFVGANASVVVPLGRIFAVIPSFSGRWIFGDENEDSYMTNQIGGVMNGRYFNHQLAFIGHNGVRQCDDILGTAEMALRCWMGKNSFVALRGGAFIDGRNIDKMNDVVYGAGLQIGYKLFFIPITANIHWNDDSCKMGFYFSMGLDF